MKIVETLMRIGALICVLIEQYESAIILLILAIDLKLDRQKEENIK